MNDNSSLLERCAAILAGVATSRPVLNGGEGESLPEQPETRVKRPQLAGTTSVVETASSPQRKIQKTQRSFHPTAAPAASSPATTLSSVALASARQKNKRTSWEDHYAALVEYKRQHGNTNVPRMYAANRALGKWVGKQRGDPSKLTQTQRDRLTALNFDWETLQERQDRRWNEKFTTLHQRKQGQSLHLVLAQDAELSKWVQNQRQLCLTGRLPRERQDKLESMGFVWQRGKRADSDEWAERSTCSDSVAGGSVSGRSTTSKTKKETPKQDEKWRQQYQKLVAFEQKHGHCKVPALYKEDRTLGEWVRTQRKAYQQHYLKPERQVLLEELGFAWKVDMPEAHSRQKEWRERLGQLEACAQENGHVRIEEMSPALKKWIQEQRGQWRDGCLSEWQVTRLQSLGLNRGGIFEKPKQNAKPKQEECSEAESGHCAESLVAAQGLVSLNRSLGQRGPPSAKVPPTQKELSAVAQKPAAKRSLDSLSPLLRCALKNKVFGDVKKMNYQQVMQALDEICGNDDGRNRDLNFPTMSDREPDSED